MKPGVRRAAVLAAMLVIVSVPFAAHASNMDGVAVVVLAIFVGGLVVLLAVVLVAGQERGKRVAGRVAIAAALIGAGVFAKHKLDQREERREAAALTAQAWSNLRVCLFDPPLGPGELPSARLLRQELSSTEVTLREWTAACAPRVRELRKGLAHMTYAWRDEPGRAYLSDRVFDRLEEIDFRGNYVGGGKPAIDEVWELMPSLGLPEVGATIATHAPPAGHPLTLAPLVTGFDYQACLCTAHPDLPAGGALRLVWPRPAKKSALFCAFGPAAPSPDAFSQVRCADVPAVGHYSAPATAPDDYDGMVAYEDGGPIVAANALEPLAPYSFREPTVLRDGTIVSLADARGKLVRYTGGSPARETKLPALRDRNYYRLLGDHLFWVEELNGARQLLARALPATPDGPPGDAVTIGTVPGDTLDACDTGDGLVVLARSEEEEIDTHDVVFPARLAVSFVTPGGWSAPVALSVTLPHWFTGVDDPLPLRCAPGEATLTWVLDSHIHQARCTPAGCTTQSVEVPELRSGLAAVAVADLGGKVALARVFWFWSPLAPTIQTRTVRLRVAPLADLAAAPETLVVGDGRHGGIPDLASLSFYSRRSAAVLIVGGGQSRYAVRVDASGAAAPVQIAR